MESDDATYAQLKEYARLLEDQIRTIQATSKIKRIGEQKEQISVYFDPDKLSQYQVSLQDVVKVLQSQNTISSGGEIKTEQSTVSIHTHGYFNTETELANQIIGTSVITSYSIHYTKLYDKVTGAVSRWLKAFCSSITFCIM